MIQKEIKNLIFDFGGVLIDLDRGRCVERFAQLGLERVEEMLGLYYQQDFFQQYEKGLISSAAFRDEIRAKSSRPLTDAEIDDAWNSFLVSIPSYKLDMLLELRRHYRVCLLSNTNEIHWLWSCANAFRYKDYGVVDYFERIYPRCRDFPPCAGRCRYACRRNPVYRRLGRELPVGRIAGTIYLYSETS